MCRCNISYLEEWLKDRKLQGSNAMNTLRPLCQAAWLLQVNKSTDGDAKEIVEECTELKPVQVPHTATRFFFSLNMASGVIPRDICLQIVKILNSYTPIDDFEKRVSPSFVRKVQVSPAVFRPPVGRIQPECSVCSSLQSMLQDRDGSAQLMFDLDYRFQVTFPFCPSTQALELLQVPSSLNLAFLTRI